MSSGGTFISLNWQVSGGGAFALLPLAQPGKLPDLYPLCRGHTSAVLDTSFSPFDDHVVVSGGDDAQLSVWKVTPDDIVQRLDDAKTSGSMDDIKPVSSFVAGRRRVGHVEFHPTASNVVAAATGDHAIKLFDIEKQTPRVDLRGFGDSIQSMAFDQTGGMIAATCRDKKLRLLDARAPDNMQTTDGHGGIKGARVIWCGDKPRIITTGFSKMSERQMFLWDVAQLTKPIKTVSLDSSNGIIMPFWSDNNIVFLAGKGDGNIRYYELESDELYYLAEYKSIEPQSGMTFLPRRALNANENEIARAYKVSYSMIQPLSFYVPRRSETFQSDIFPPARSTTPPLTATEFFDEKKTATPNLLNLETRESIHGSQATSLPGNLQASTGEKEPDLKSSGDAEPCKEEVSNAAVTSKDAKQEDSKTAKEPADAIPKSESKETDKEKAKDAIVKPADEVNAKGAKGADKSNAKEAEVKPSGKADSDENETKLDDNVGSKDPPAQPAVNDVSREAEPKTDTNYVPATIAQSTQRDSEDVHSNEPSMNDAAPLHPDRTQDAKPSSASSSLATVASKNDTTSQVTPNTAVSDVDALKTQIQDLQAQVAERDTHIRELEMENIKYVDPFFLSLSLSFSFILTLYFAGSASISNVFAMCCLLPRRAYNAQTALALHAAADYKEGIYVNT